MRRILQGAVSVLAASAAVFAISGGTAGADTTVDIGGTWDTTGSALPALIAPSYEKGDQKIQVSYLASGFDFNGVSYGQSLQTGIDGTAAAIQQAAATTGGKIPVNMFSQGADAGIAGTRKAIEAGVDPDRLFLNAVASPVQPGSGLRNRLPADMFGIPQGDGGSTSGASVRWTCFRGDVCDVPNDLDPIKWIDTLGVYWFQHAGHSSSGCGYANVEACNGQTYVKVDGNQEFVTHVGESGIVQAFDQGGVSLPEAAKVAIRTHVAGGEPVYTPTTPVVAETASPVAEVSVSEPVVTEQVNADPTVTAAHDFVDNAGLDPNTTAALNGAVDAIAGVFGR